ncbi:MAG: PilZ domain-containing protein [Planctomycetota bacterium]
MLILERRESPREPADLALRVRTATGASLAGRTVDLSASGAWARIDRPMRLQPGQRVDLQLAFEPGSADADLGESLHARVVRSLGFGEAQHVALAFDRRVGRPSIDRPA